MTLTWSPSVCLCHFSMANWTSWHISRLSITQPRDLDLWPQHANMQIKKQVSKQTNLAISYPNVQSHSVSWCLAAKRDTRDQCHPLTLWFCKEFAFIFYCTSAQGKLGLMYNKKQLQTKWKVKFHKQELFHYQQSNYMHKTITPCISPTSKLVLQNKIIIYQSITEVYRYHTDCCII